MYATEGEKDEQEKTDKTGAFTLAITSLKVKTVLE